MNVKSFNFKINRHEKNFKFKCDLCPTNTVGFYKKVHLDRHIDKVHKSAVRLEMGEDDSNSNSTYASEGSPDEVYQGQGQGQAQPTVHVQPQHLPPPPPLQQTHQYLRLVQHPGSGPSILPHPHQILYDR